jgi:hypothetical protein
MDFLWVFLKIFFKGFKFFQGGGKAMGNEFVSIHFIGVPQ